MRQCLNLVLSGTVQSLVPPCHRSGWLDGSSLANATSVIDLGNGINSDLSFQSLIGSIVSEARQRVGVLFQGFHTRQVSFLKRLLPHTYVGS